MIPIKYHLKMLKIYKREIIMRHLIAVVALTAIPAFAYAGPTTLNHPGRTLAANCFQCHGTDGTGMEKLAGKSSSEILKELQEYQFKTARQDIMAVHAQVYTAEELRLIADYFSKQ